MARRPELAVALDVADVAQALALVDRLGEMVPWYKVGPALFVRDGPVLVRELRRRSRRTFLDLKWHDIPSTIAGAVAAAADLGVELATLHAAGGSRMLEAAARAAQGTPLRLVGVGVLTSLTAADFGSAIARTVADLGAEQERLARLALSAGLAGVVTAVAEAPRLRRALGDALLVAPGIRPAGAPPDDQRRTATPAEAARAGVDLLVVGRPISGAADPAAAARAIAAELGP